MTASAVLFLFNVIETKFLGASPTLKFSHSLDPNSFLARKFSAATMGNAFNSVGAPSARRFALVAAFVAHCTSAGGAADAADAPAPARQQAICDLRQLARIRDSQALQHADAVLFPDCCSDIR